MGEMSYSDWLASKSFRDVESGFDICVDDLGHDLFDFQKALVRWALARGRSAIFADTGLGKTIMQSE